MNKKSALIPGSFDPITNGHLDIIMRASKLFDAVVVLVSENIDKRYLYSAEARKTFVEKSVSELPNVTVDLWQGLTVDYMKQHSISILVRGVRNSIDFEIENQLALMNKKLYIECETVYIPADPVLTALSSTVVRDLLKHKSDLSPFVPHAIAEDLKKKQYVNTI